MVRVNLRRVAAIAAVAAAAINSPSALAAPAPRPAPVPSGASSVPADLAVAIQRDLGISVAEYLSRAARAQDLARFGERFERSHPGELAAVRLDPSGTPVVAVTNSSAASAVNAAGFVAELVADLLGTAPLNSVNDEALPPPAAALPFPVPPELQNLAAPIALPNPGPVEQIAMGGDSYVTSNRALADTPEDEIVVCSFGLNAVDEKGTALNISAGHCDPGGYAATGSGSGATVYLPNADDVHNSFPIGHFVAASVGTTNADLDYSVIALNEDPATEGLRRPVVRGDRGTTLTITGTAVPVAGAPVCKTGRTSGFTCGTVVSDHVTASLHNAAAPEQSINGFSTTLCTLSGDSGGAIVTGTQALGIVSGSNSSQALNCDLANVSHVLDGGTLSLGIPVEAIVQDAQAKLGRLTIRSASVT